MPEKPEKVESISKFWGRRPPCYDPYHYGIEIWYGRKLLRLDDVIYRIRSVAYFRAWEIFYSYASSLRQRVIVRNLDTRQVLARSIGRNRFEPPMLSGLPIEKDDYADLSPKR